MAVNPNTDFATGATLSSNQMNRLPRGIVAYNAATSSDTTITAEEIQITLASFTAVANRLYKIIYFEPAFGSSTAATMTMRVRRTNIAGTILQATNVYNNAFYQQNGILVCYATFTAGSVVIVGTLQNSAGTGQAVRSATSFATLSVEDVGPI